VDAVVNGESPDDENIVEADSTERETQPPTCVRGESGQIVETGALPQPPPSVEPGTPNQSPPGIAIELHENDRHHSYILPAGDVESL